MPADFFMENLHSHLKQMNTFNTNSTFIEPTRDLSLAIKVAARFSNGAAISEGSNFIKKSTLRGSFNVCYWVRLDGLSIQWVVRFPRPRMLSNDIMIAKHKLRSCDHEIP